MDCAVFGVPMDGAGIANFGGVDGGQGWLAGSDPSLVESLQGRHILQMHFPLLRSPRVSREGHADLNALGVIHLQVRRGGTYLVHAHQPSYSALRSIPLWMCVRLPSEASLHSAPIGLVSVIRNMRAVASRLAENRGRPEELIVRLSNLEGLAEEAKLGGLEMIRLGCAGYEDLTQSAKPSYSDSPGYWEVMGRLCEEAIAKRPSLSKDLPTWPIAFALEPGGELDWQGPKELCPRLLQPSSGSISAGAREFRGVRDEELLLEVQGLPDKVLAALGASVIESWSKPTTDGVSRRRPTIEELCDSMVPLHLVPEKLLREEEFFLWARAVYARGDDWKSKFTAHLDCIRRCRETGREATIEIRRLTALLWPSVDSSNSDRARWAADQARSLSKT